MTVTGSSSGTTWRILPDVDGASRRLTFVVAINVVPTATDPPSASSLFTTASSGVAITSSPSIGAQAEREKIEAARAVVTSDRMRWTGCVMALDTPGVALSLQ